MTAEKYESGYMPAHDEHTDGNAHNSKADGAYIAEVFGCQEKRIGAEGFHESSIDRTKQNEPEYEQYLVLPEVEEKKLYGKRVIKTSEPFFHLPIRIFFQGPDAGTKINT